MSENLYYDRDLLYVLKKKQEKKVKEEEDKEEVFTLDESKKEKCRQFVEKNKGKPFAFVTSGGTSVPFEKNTIRTLENFSTG